ISSAMTLSLARPPSRLLSPSHSAFFNKTHNSLYAHTLVLSKPRRCRTRKPLTCYALFGLGVPELVVIAGVAALVFGPKQLPQVGKTIGKTVKSFQQAAKEFESELKKDPESISESPGQSSTAVSEEKKEEEVSSSKESLSSNFFTSYNG
ncbi:hypothetical protein Tsubulata_037167, partial [Turnera subulata]